MQPSPSHARRPPLQPVRIRPVAPRELEQQLPALVELLRDTVNRGTPLGFQAPLTREEAAEYWLSLRPELLAGSRLLLVACTADSVVGTGQLAFPPAANAWHRAELQKLFVAAGQRGLGVGRALMAALHETAVRHGRSLVVLQTRRGNPAEGLYRSFGYREVGVLPGWTMGPAGERYDHVMLCRDLSDPQAGSRVRGAMGAAAG